MIQICTDSCADLSSTLIEQHHIHVIPLQVFINEENIHDGDISLERLFELVAETGKLPVTSAPSMADFVKFFSANDETIFIGISSQLSGTLQSAQMAAKELPDRQIHIIDSLNLSTGIGLLVLKAADLRDSGLLAEEIVEALKAWIPRVRSSFVIDTMEYLYKGGRCSGIQALAGSILKIRPIISVQQDGKMVVKHKIRGPRQKALDTLVQDFEQDLPAIDQTRVFVTHSGCEADAFYLKDKLLGLIPSLNVQITTAGATIGSHCGPDTIGILYMKTG